MPTLASYTLLDGVLMNDAEKKVVLVLAIGGIAFAIVLAIVAFYSEARQDQYVPCED